MTVEVEITRQVEVAVTREVYLTREVPVTVEVEAIREVDVEIPVTVEVTREVLSTVPVEVTREIEVTRQVPVTVEVTREVEIPVTVEVERHGAQLPDISIFDDVDQVSVSFCGDFVSETDSRDRFSFLAPLNVALGNVGDDEEIGSRYLLGLILNALTISLAGFDYPDDEENDWDRASKVAEDVLLYDYCLDAVAYAEATAPDA